RQRRLSQILDVIGDHIAAPLDGRPGARRVAQGDRAARAGAEVNVLVLARGLDDVDDVLLEAIVDVYFLDRVLRREQTLGVDHLLDSVDRVAGALRVQDGNLVL